MMFVRLLFLLLYPSSLMALQSPEKYNVKEIKETFELKKDEMQKKMPELFGLMQSVKFHETVVNGGDKGVKITGIPKDSVLEKAGLQNDDVIIGLNDIKFDKASQGLKIFDELRKAKKFNLKINRDGLTKDLAIDFK